MARLHLTFPEQPMFSTELTVRVADLNYGAHVGNDSILTLMQEARVALYRQWGFKDEISFEGPIGQIIADAAVQYKSEAFLGDVLVIHIAIDDISTYGFDMLYKIVNKFSNKEVAVGKTGIVCFDYEKRRVAHIPSLLREKIKTTKH